MKKEYFIKTIAISFLIAIFVILLNPLGKVQSILEPILKNNLIDDYVKIETKITCDLCNEIYFIRVMDEEHNYYGSDSPFEIIKKENLMFVDTIFLSQFYKWIYFKNNWYMNNDLKEKMSRKKAEEKAEILTKKLEKMILKLEKNINIKKQHEEDKLRNLKTWEKS